MKRILRYGILAVIVSSLLSGCVKLREDATVERIRKPQFNVTVPPPAEWDGEEGTGDIPIGK